jgi:hypothetical protein
VVERVGGLVLVRVTVGMGQLGWLFGGFRSSLAYLFKWVGGVVVQLGLDTAERLSHLDLIVGAIPGAD